MKTPILAFAAAATLVTGAPALAGDAQAGDMVVRYADLDLSTAAGQETLQTRIDAAAKKYCAAGVHTSGTRLSVSQSQTCVREVTRIAARQFDAIMDETRLGG